MSANSLDKKFQRNVTIPSVIWLALCLIYITVSVGWGNLSSFLIQELAVLVLGLTMPVAMLAVLCTNKRESQANEELSAHVNQ